MDNLAFVIICSAFGVFAAFLISFLVALALKKDDNNKEVTTKE